MAEPDKDDAKGKKDKEAILKLALKRYRLASDYWNKQRDRETKALRFQVPELQWDEAAKAARGGGMTGGIPVPARPMLSINKTDQPIQLVLNQERNAHLGVNVHPLSPDANDETAEVYQGMYRQIERESQAGQARSRAFDRAVKCGTGAYRIGTKYDDAGGHPFDQVITIESLLYQDAVLLDPSAQKPDFSDGKYAFLRSWMPIDDFKRQYPEAEISQSDELASAMTDTPEWIKGDGDTMAVLVAEYWYKEFESETWVALTNGQAIPEEELTENDEVDESIPKRIKDEVAVQWCKITALEILDSEEWMGHYIPLVPTIGRELQSFDSERRFSGMIEPAMDSQRLFNYAVSTAVEIAALEPKAPWIAAEGSFENHEDEWKQSNTRNFPYLTYKPVTHQGNLLPPPARTPIDGSRLSVSLQLMQEADKGVQGTTATFDPSLGQLPTKDRSGKAIQALQGQSDAGNSHFLANLANISMALEARIVVDLIPAIYDRKGRLARTLDDEDGSETVMLNAPHIVDPATKMPQEVQQPMMLPPGMPAPAMGGMPPPGGNGGPPPGMMPPGMMTGMGLPGGPPAPPKPQVKHYDLRKGVYGVEISIGKSWQSKLEQGSEEIGQILQNDPSLMPLIGPLYFKYRDFPGAEDIAALLKKVREKQFPGLDTKEGEQPSPEAAQAQLEGMKQQIQQLEQQLQAAGQQIQTDQAKQGAQIETAKINASKEIELQRMRDATSIAVAEINARAKGVLSAMEAEHESLATGQEQAHEVGMQMLDLEHQKQMTSQGQAFQEAQDASGQAHEAGMAAQPPPLDPNAQQPEATE